MGLFKQLEAESRRVAARNTRSPIGQAGPKVRVEVTESTEKLLKALPWELRDKVLRKAVNDGGRVVIRSARNNVAKHRSKNTGTNQLWSKKLKQQRGNRRWDLWQSIGQRVRMYDSAVVAFVGARKPWGSHAHLLEKGGVFPRWGKRATYQPPRPFLRPAGHSTLSAQQQAVVTRVKREWKNV